MGSANDTTILCQFCKQFPGFPVRWTVSDDTISTRVETSYWCQQCVDTMIARGTAVPFTAPWNEQRLMDLLKIHGPLDLETLCMLLPTHTRGEKHRVNKTLWALQRQGRLRERRLWEVSTDATSSHPQRA